MEKFGLHTLRAWVGLIFNFGFPFCFSFFLYLRIIVVVLVLPVFFRVFDGFFCSFSRGFPKWCPVLGDLLGRVWYKKWRLSGIAHSLATFQSVKLYVSNFGIAGCLTRRRQRALILMIHPTVVSSGNGECDEDVQPFSLSDNGIAQSVPWFGTRMPPVNLLSVRALEHGIG